MSAIFFGFICGISVVDCYILTTGTAIIKLPLRRPGIAPDAIGQILEKHLRASSYHNLMLMERKHDETIVQEKRGAN